MSLLRSWDTTIDVWLDKTVNSIKACIASTLFIFLSIIVCSVGGQWDSDGHVTYGVLHVFGGSTTIPYSNQPMWSTCYAAGQAMTAFLFLACLFNGVHCAHVILIYPIQKRARALKWLTWAPCLCAVFLFVSWITWVTTSHVQIRKNEVIATNLSVGFAFALLAWLTASGNVYFGYRLRKAIQTGDLPDDSATTVSNARLKAKLVSTGGYGSLSS